MPILAGTDAPNPGTAHGVALHRELALLVRAGLTPTEALTAATAGPARAFGLDDRGRIAPGLRADLLLVDGDPTRDITATRQIAAIWKGGVPVERPRQEKPPAALPGTAPSPALQPGPVDAFESLRPGAPLGAHWMPSTDAMMGGGSSVDVVVETGSPTGDRAEDRVEDGATEPRAAGPVVAVSGSIGESGAYPWAGAMWLPGETPMAPVDLAGTGGLAFRARGDGGTYRLMVFAQDLGRIPATVTFPAGPDWRRREVRWSELGLDGRGIQGVLWSGGPETGSFSFRIADVELLPR